ncbi:MAG: uroporphyrinogen-III C-methyltransferase [Geminicoccaceae bacterium]
MSVRADGKVWFVGAGCGDPELLTLKAARLIEVADVIVYDRLVSRRVMERASVSAETIYAGKRRADHHLLQGEINQLLVDRAKQGCSVVRLKGGDPTIFGRLGEELDAVVQAKVAFEIVPGVSAGTGCAAYAGIPLTHRDLAHAVTFLTGHGKADEPELDWRALATSGHTLCVFMGIAGIERLVAKLLDHGMDPKMPAALIENGTLPQQRVASATLDELSRTVGSVRPTGPVTVIIGKVAALQPHYNWFIPAGTTSASGFSGADLQNTAQAPAMINRRTA